MMHLLAIGYDRSTRSSSLLNVVRDNAALDVCQEI